MLRFTFDLKNKMTVMNQRTQDLKNWCSQLPLLQGKVFDFSMVSGDASFRRYFRIHLNASSYIAVDAPPEHENSLQFCKVAALFSEQGACVPEVLATDFSQGFMLLSDLGDRQLLSEINADNAQFFYGLAFDEIIKIQKAKVLDNQLPYYDQEKLMQEMLLFQTWFVEKLLKLTLTEQEQQIILKTQLTIIDKVLQQQQVYVHRDFHSRNLMIVEKNNSLNIALIDFQDAVIGAITYDAVSLLKDCYIEWNQQQRNGFLENYFNKLVQQNVLTNTECFESFHKDFEWMGLQRHLKILGIFARLSIRDAKHGYLKDLPLTFHYVEDALLNFPELKDFSDLILGKIKQKFKTFDL